MSLYDDIDSSQRGGAAAEHAPGWGSANIKLLQSQLKLRKAAINQQPRQTSSRRPAMAPVINLKGKRDDEEMSAPVTAATLMAAQLSARSHGSRGSSQLSALGPDVELKNEYDPMKPNEYDKVVRDMRRRKDQERDRERREKKEKEKEKEQVTGALRGLVGNYSDDDDEEMTAKEEERKRKSAIGAAIAPPSALQGGSDSPPPAFGARPAIPGAGAASIAAKIMAKYGYKEGQGLGKAGQGISRALAVEKTSKRGGRIIHEATEAAAGGGSGSGPGSGSNSPAPADMMPPPPAPPPPPAEPTMAEILRNPTKVVMLRNMVGPGEVDDELEAEVKEECTTKYGDVVKVTILEVAGAADQDAVRIFVEFRRVENSIKAVVDLNGRFFGGRQVRARFYNQDKYDDLELNVHVP